jgi:septin family protein
MNMFRHGFRLNLMVVGEEGLGKASLVNSLFKANAQSYSAPLIRIWNTVIVLLYTWRTRLSCGRVIWLLSHPLTPLSRQQVVSLSQPSYVSPAELMKGEEGRGGG